MNCERIREQIPACLAGHLDQAARDRFVEHLESCAGCRAEVAELNAVWRAMESLGNSKDEAPSQAAKARFLNVLDAYHAGLGVAATERPKPKTGFWGFGGNPVWQAALAAGLVVAGIFTGRYVAQPKTDVTEVAQLKGQVESLRQLVALSMLQQQSPAARLKGVSYSEEIARPDREVEQALLFAISHDSNVNVRLSAVDALQKFAGNPEVARAMIDAVPLQDSPMVQIAIIDMLVQMKVKAAAPAMVRLAQDKQADDTVQQRATLAVQQLGGLR